MGLKIDVDALPSSLQQALRQGRVNLDDAAVTLDLLRLNAVVGVTGFFDAKRNLASIGIQCALCHSTVDDSLAPGVGHRLDAWANRDLDVGAIVAPSPDLSAVASLLGVDDPTVRKVLASWGPGRFDAELFLDGEPFTPDGKSASSLIPPAFGLAGVNLHTHAPPTFTEPGWNLHTPDEPCINDFEANRAPDRRYRTSPLRGLWTHEKGGFYHDGRFATLRDVVDHYNAHFRLQLSDAEAGDLVEYLKSL